MLCVIVMLFGVGSALAQPTYQFAGTGTKNFITETDIVVGTQVSLDLYLSNVGAPQNAGGAWIDFMGSTSTISYVSGGRCMLDGSEGCTGPWQDLGVLINEPVGPGTFLMVVRNLDGAAPDVDGDLIIGNITLKCVAEGDATVDLTTIPGYQTWAPINDGQIVPGSLLIHQVPCTNDDECSDLALCNGVETCDVGGTNTCQPGTSEPDGTACDDNIFCNGDDLCQNGICEGYTGNPCPPDTFCDEVVDECEIDHDGDEDGIPDNQDNCPNTPNPLQEDTYPPQGNNIGDACDCETDFNCNGSVDANDVTAFLVDFGRSRYNDPCSNDNQCNGDVDCNSAVDALDLDKFLEDFGRSRFNNPCPACEVGDKCRYPIRYLIDTIPGTTGKNFPTPQSMTLTMGSTACVDIYLSNVGTPQYAGGAWLNFQGSTADIAYVNAGRALSDGSEGVNGPWDPATGVLVNEPAGPGTFMYFVANLDGAVPDVDGHLIVGQVCLRHESTNDATVNITTIPSVATWTPIDDEDIISGSFVIHE